MRMAARLFLASAALGGLFGPAAAEELAASSLPLFAQNLQPKPQEPSIWSGDRSASTVFSTAPGP